MKQIDGHAMIQRVECLYKKGKVDLPYYNIVKEAVQMEPAVDAAPVVHGEWKWSDGGQCSECGFHNSNFDYNFCPNCGAKMDADQNLVFADQSGAEYADNPTV